MTWTCLPRAQEIEVENLHPFVDWFPLGANQTTPTSLKRLAITGPAWQASTFNQEAMESSNGPILGAPCPTLRFLALCTTSVVTNPVNALSRMLLNAGFYAKFITHLDIEVSDEVDEVYVALAHFPELKFLRWRWIESGWGRVTPDLTTSQISLSLRNLRTLVLCGSSIMRAFSGISTTNTTEALPPIEAPILSELYLGDFRSANWGNDLNGDWGLVHPSPFFDTLKSITITNAHYWDVEKFVDIIINHSLSLEIATFVLAAERVAPFIRAFSRLFVRAAESSTARRNDAHLATILLENLLRLNVSCGQNQSPSYHDAQIACQLEMLLIQRRLALTSLLSTPIPVVESVPLLSSLSASSFPSQPSDSPPILHSEAPGPIFNFKLGLASVIVDQCPSVKTLVDANSEVLERFVLHEAPRLYYKPSWRHHFDQSMSMIIVYSRMCFKLACLSTVLILVYHLPICFVRKVSVSDRTIGPSVSSRLSSGFRSTSNCFPRSGHC